MYRITLTCNIRGIREPALFYMYFYEEPSMEECKRVCESRDTWAEDWRWSNLIYDPDV